MLQTTIMNEHVLAWLEWRVRQALSRYADYEFLAEEWSDGSFAKALDDAAEELDAAELELELEFGQLY